MTYSLGVDLGTTFVAAAVARPAGVEMFTLGDRTVVTPAVVYPGEDGSIITGKLLGPKQVDSKSVDAPWYPADVRANAIPDLAGLFTSTRDNWVFPFTRYSSGHSMDFTLRPGERITRRP